MTLVDFWRALLGIATPAAAIIAVTLAAVVRPQLQGIALTVIALGFFIVAMTLMPQGRCTRLRLLGPAAAPSTAAANRANAAIRVAADRIALNHPAVQPSPY